MSGRHSGFDKQEQSGSGSYGDIRPVQVRVAVEVGAHDVAPAALARPLERAARRLPANGAVDRELARQTQVALPPALSLGLGAQIVALLVHEQAAALAAHACVVWQSASANRERSGRASGRLISFTDAPLLSKQIWQTCALRNARQAEATRKKLSDADFYNECE